LNIGSNIYIIIDTNNESEIPKVRGNWGRMRLTSSHPRFTRQNNIWTAESFGLIRIQRPEKYKENFNVLSKSPSSRCY
jgi:hypothetical protein